MMNALEIQVEMLRAELRNADPAQRRQIEAELEQAYTEVQRAQRARNSIEISGWHSLERGSV